MKFELTEKQIKVMQDNRDAASAIMLINKQLGGNELIVTLADLYVNLVDTIKEGKINEL